jgi:hypothetical protein
MSWLVWSVSAKIHGGFSVTYTDMIEFDGPHLPGDEGSMITSEKHALIGLDVAGDENRTFAIKASRVTAALGLDLIRLSDGGWRAVHMWSYFNKFSDNCRVSLCPRRNVLLRKRSLLGLPKDQATREGKKALRVSGLG